MQINHYILEKLGWISPDWEPLLCRSALLQIASGIPNIDIVKIFVDQTRIYFISADFIVERSRKTWINYRFSDFESVDSLKLISITDFNSNIELFSLIKQNLSCNKTYKRLFQLNSLLNEKTS